VNLDENDLVMDVARVVPEDEGEIAGDDSGEVVPIGPEDEEE
jgi:hypothetical protein